MNHRSFYRVSNLIIRNPKHIGNENSSTEDIHVCQVYSKDLTLARLSAFFFAVDAIG